MKIIHILAEAIYSPLYNTARENLNKSITQWGSEQADALGKTNSSLITMEKQRQNLLAQHEQTQDWKIYDKASEMLHQQYEIYYDLVADADSDTQLHQKIVNSFKKMVEDSLRETAKQHVESLFGPIDQYTSKDFDEIKMKNLYWLRFIIVDIDITATYPKSGHPRTGGGYFNIYPSKEQHTDEYSQTQVQWGDQLGVAIKIYSSENELWMAARETILHVQARKFFGESDRDDALNKWLSNVMPTFVHELVHLEQRSRKQVKRGPGHVHGISYTPQVKGRNFKSWKTGHEETVRGGVRGRPSHLTDIENVNTSEWIEYFGTDHEIEAHAAGAAAAIVHDFGNDPHYMNYNIDNVIRNISMGYLPDNVPSIQHYETHIKNNASKLLRLRAWKDERALSKINIGARKVWTIFLSKLVKHLQSYKKPEYNENPDYKLAYSANKPTLPG